MPSSVQWFGAYVAATATGIHHNHNRGDVREAVVASELVRLTGGWS